DVALEAASAQELLDGTLTSGLLPEALEDQGRPDAPGGDGGELPLGVGREEQDRSGQACTRGQEGVETAVLLELIESSQGGDDPLSGATVLPAILDEREVGAWAGGLGREEHGSLTVGDTMIIRQIGGFSRTFWCRRGTRIGAPERSPAHHQRSYVENRAATVKKKLGRGTGDPHQC